MMREGIDVLVETARMWADLGFWLGRGEGRRFHLHGVTGPDEYTTVVNNNLFTNVMATDNLRQAARWARRLREEFPEAYARMVARLDVDDARGRGVGGLRRGDVHPLRRGAARAPAGPALPRARGVGPRGDPGLTSGPCCCTTTRW